MKLDITTLRSLTDELRLPSRLTADNDLYVNIASDGDFPYETVVCIMIEHGCRLSFVGMAPEYEPAGDLLFLANRSNRRNYVPTAVVRDGRIHMEYSFYINEDVSREFIKEDCLLVTLEGISNAFANLEKDNIE